MNKAQFAKWTLASTVLVTLMVACGKKDDGGSVADNPCVNTYNGQVVNGITCIAGAPINNGSVGLGNLLNNVQFNSSYINGVMSISATNQGLDFSNPYIYASYSGAISVSGNAQVQQQLCGAPAGSYTIVNNGQAGQYYNGVIQNLNITLQGPTTIQLVGNFMTSQVYNPQGLSRDASGNRIGMNVQVVVNGAPCGSLSTY